MSHHAVYLPHDAIVNEAHIKSIEVYNNLHLKSLNNASEFWANIASSYYWSVNPSEENLLSYNFNLNSGPIFIRWFADGKTNICYNCLDRHIECGHGNRVAFHWQGNNPTDVRSVTFKELLDEVIIFGNTLRRLGIGKGDNVVIYMPMVLEEVIVILACARIGAVHSVVFGGFSAESLAERIFNSESHILITCDGAWRGAKLIDFMSVATRAMEICDERLHSIKYCIVLRHVTPKPQCFRLETQEDSEKIIPGRRPVPGFTTSLRTGRDLWWDEVIACSDSTVCDIEWMDAEDTLFLLYTSGSTGSPKGMVHTTGGYMVYAGCTTKYTFDLHDNDVYWCTADIGWITGHTYLVYGPLLNGVTSVMFEGLPTWPDMGRYWSIVQQYAVTKFYTAPTVIRMLAGAGDDYIKSYDISSLKILGSVGEPISPTTWRWYYDVVGAGNCSIVDTYWQTETGGHVITPLPGATPMKPGSAGRPFFGVDARVLRDFSLGETNNPNSALEGNLAIAAPWPGISRTIFKNHERFENTYFRRFPGFFVTGDSAKIDEDGDIWVTGRVDDMVNMSGHLLSTAQVEAALVSHSLVAEAAVVSRPHQLKGECLYCFVTLTNGETEISSSLRQELVKAVRSKIGPFAAPDFFQAAKSLPKTRSGKIVRRILRSVVTGNRDVGDVSTLADANCLDDLFANVQIP